MDIEQRHRTEAIRDNARVIINEPPALRARILRDEGVRRRTGGVEALLYFFDEIILNSAHDSQRANAMERDTIGIDSETMGVSFKNLAILSVKKRDTETSMRMREEIRIWSILQWVYSDDVFRMCIPLKPVVSDPIYDIRRRLVVQDDDLFWLTPIG